MLLQSISTLWYSIVVVVISYLQSADRLSLRMRAVERQMLFRLKGAAESEQQQSYYSR